MVTYHEQPFNGSFMKKSVFRKDPGPEVDAAWESLGINSLFPLHEDCARVYWLEKDRVIRLAPEDAHRAGLASDYVKINEKHGGGYPANIEGFHHLHCLVSHAFPILDSWLTDFYFYYYLFSERFAPNALLQLWALSWPWYRHIQKWRVYRQDACQ